MVELEVVVVEVVVVGATVVGVVIDAVVVASLVDFSSFSSAPGACVSACFAVIVVIVVVGSVVVVVDSVDVVTSSGMPLWSLGGKGIEGNEPSVGAAGLLL